MTRAVLQNLYAPSWSTVRQRFRRERLLPEVESPIPCSSFRAASPGKTFFVRYLTSIGPKHIDLKLRR